MTAAEEQRADYQRHERTELRDEIRRLHRELAAERRERQLLELMAARNETANRREAKGEG